jgi:hypothetical protein
MTTNLWDSSNLIGLSIRQQKDSINPADSLSPPAGDKYDNESRGVIESYELPAICR